MFPKNNIIDLAARAAQTYSQERQRYNGNEMVPLKEREVECVANGLGVTFARDFIELNSLFNYCFFHQFEFYTFLYQQCSGVSEETFAARELWQLPHKYVILAVEDDVSVVLLETQDTPDKPSPVIWCDMFPDYFNLCKGKPMEQNPTIWPSFTDFFEYLVEQEEAMLKEQEK